MLGQFATDFRQAASVGSVLDADRALAGYLGDCAEVTVEVSDNPTQPFVVAVWRIESDRRSKLLISPARVTPERAEFAVTRLAFTVPMIAQYHRIGAPVLGSVSINLDDNRVSPGLSFCDHMPDAFLIPDPVYISTDAYSEVGRQFEAHPVDWIDRRPVALWRGTTTGRLHDFPSWRELPRVRLCEIARTSDGAIDAKLSSLSQVVEHEDELRNSGLMGDFVPVHDFHRYKYHIDIDGNTNSWPGLFQKLLTGSPVLKVASGLGFKQWYYHRLQPWVNYIPVAADMSDLLLNLRWLSEHDKAARQIGEAGRELAISMDYAGEIRRAAGTIAAAVRSANVSHQSDAGKRQYASTD